MEGQLGMEKRARPNLDRARNLTTHRAKALSSSMGVWRRKAPNAMNPYHNASLHMQVCLIKVGSNEAKTNCQDDETANLHAKLARTHRDQHTPTYDMPYEMSAAAHGHTPRLNASAASSPGCSPSYLSSVLSPRWTPLAMTKQSRGSPFASSASK